MTSGGRSAFTSFIFLRNCKNSIGTSREGVESLNWNEIEVKPGLA